MEAALRQVRIIYFALILSAVMSITAGELIQIPPSPDLTIMVLVFGFVGLADLGLGFFLRQSILGSAQETLRRDPKNNEALQSWRRGNILSFVFGTTVVVFGLVVRVLVGRIELALPFYIIGGIATCIGAWIGYPDLSFQKIVGAVFAPVMYMLNVPSSDIMTAGGLFGTKLVLNEFVAFTQLGPLKEALAPATVAIVTFALCGFSNFSSIAIQLAVTGGLAPNQRATIARLGLKALLAGSLANLMSAALAGLLVTG